MHITVNPTWSKSGIQWEKKTSFSQVCKNMLRILWVTVLFLSI